VRIFAKVSRNFACAVALISRSSQSAFPLRTNPCVVSRGNSKRASRWLFLEGGKLMFPSDLICRGGPGSPRGARQNRRIHRADTLQLHREFESSCARAMMCSPSREILQLQLVFSAGARNVMRPALVLDGQLDLGESFAHVGRRFLLPRSAGVTPEFLVQTLQDREFSSRSFRRAIASSVARISASACHGFLNVPRVCSARSKSLCAFCSSPRAARQQIPDRSRL